MENQIQTGNTKNGNEAKRERIFNLYSSNLHMLVNNGLLDIKLQYKKTYICPLCLEQFGEESLSQKSKNPLTLEDVPPVSLGGHANILTCRRCNNLCGQKIDHHLSKRMEDLTNSKFLPNSTFRAVFSNNIIGKVNGTVKIDENRVVQMIHDGNHNSPGKVDAFAATITEDDENRLVNVEMKDLRVDSNKVAIALLKITYLRMFEEYGYSFLFFEPYRRVRNQILESDTMIYPIEKWVISGEDIKIPGEGVFYLSEPGIECFIVSFHLKVNNYKHHVCTLLPLKYPIYYAIKGFEFKSKAHISSDLIKRYLGFGLPEMNFSVTGEKLDYEKRFLADYVKTSRLVNKINAGNYNF